MAMTAIPYFLEFRIEGSIDGSRDTCQIPDLAEETRSHLINRF